MYTHLAIHTSVNLLQSGIANSSTLLKNVESFSILLAENGNNTNGSRRIERENISESLISGCILFMHTRYLVIDVRLVNSSEKNNISFAREVINTDVNFTNNTTSSVLIPYTVIMEKAELQMAMGICLCNDMCMQSM